MGLRAVLIISAMALSLLFTADSNASASKCASLVQELQAMQKAQHQLFQSFSQKNGTVARTFDQHANQLDKKLAQQGKLKKSDLQVLKQSANAFRGHELRESNLVQRFEKASQQLFDQVQSCLEAKSDLASLQN